MRTTKMKTFVAISFLTLSAVSGIAQPQGQRVDVFRLYGGLTGRTVLRTSSLPRLPESILDNVSADPLEKSNSIARIEAALTDLDVDVIRDGEKFVWVLPSGWSNSPVAKIFAGIKRPASRSSDTNAANETLPAGTIDMRNVPVDQVLRIYAILCNRTVLQPASLPSPPIQLVTQTQLSKDEAIYAIKVVLALNGIGTVEDGDKFVQVVPLGQMLQIRPAAPKPDAGAAMNAAKETLPAGTINMRNVPVDQVLSIYASLCSRSVLQPANLPSPPIQLVTQTPLSRDEAMYAIKVVLALNGIGTVEDGDKFVQVVPLRQMPRVHAAAPRAGPGDPVIEPSKVPKLRRVFLKVPGQNPAPPPIVDSLLACYSELTGQKAMHSESVGGVSVVFDTQTPLTRGELLYAIETTMNLNGLAIVPGEDGSVRVERLRPR